MCLVLYADGTANASISKKQMPADMRIRIRAQCQHSGVSQDENNQMGKTASFELYFFLSQLIFFLRSEMKSRFRVSHFFPMYKSSGNASPI